MIEWVSTGVLIFTLLAILSVRRDYRRRTQLSPLSVTLVWTTYLAHAATVIWASLAATWPLAIPRTFAWILGPALAAAGLILLILAIWQFRSLQRMSGVETDALITGGIYSWSRNPQNVGWWLALLGIGILGRSGLALVLVIAFALLVHLYIVKLEEPYLESIYGAEYRHYLDETARYFGTASMKEKDALE